MAYTEKYPLNPTPQGDTVAQAIKKNRSELLEIANYSAQQSSAASGALRQRVLHAKVVDGEYAYLTSDGLAITIKGSEVPVLVSFADGFDGKVSLNYIEEVAVDVSPWVLNANSTSYLYLEYKNGLIDYGSTSIAPMYQKEEPTGETGAHYFNPLEQKMYFYNGTNWTNVTRVFIAKVVTNSTEVESITYLELEDDTYTALKNISELWSDLNNYSLKTDLENYPSYSDSNVITDIMIGDRTIVDTNVPTTDIGKISEQLNYLANQIKEIKGTATWRTSPIKSIASIATSLGQGGIVASNLGTTGYVKYANGFTIQWGYTNTDLDNYHKIATLPIAFANNDYRVVATPAAALDDGYFYSYKWNDQQSTTTKIQFEMKQTNGSHSIAGLVWFALGKA